MCLQLFIVPAISGRVGADRLAKVSGLRVRKANQPVSGALWFSVDGGCSCSLMGDDADFDDHLWRLDPSVLEGLAAAAEFVAREADGLSFHAYWIGGRPEARNQVSLRELLQDIRKNQIKNRLVYLVGRAA